MSTDHWKEINKDVLFELISRVCPKCQFAWYRKAPCLSIYHRMGQRDINKVDIDLKFQKIWLSKDF